MNQSHEIRFIVVDRMDKSKLEQNACYLERNNWDDYGFKTSFELYFNDANSKLTNIGGVCIMSLGQTSGFTQMPESTFLTLDGSYCSLGHSQGYYEELMGLQAADREQILKSLKDCVRDPDVFKLFQGEDGMQTSLLRHASLQDIDVLFKSILNGQIILTPYYFEYWINNDEKTKIVVDVEPDLNPPSNLHVLIGSNGVGKTRILSGIADSLVNNKLSKTSQDGCLVFKDPHPFSASSHGRFANLITVVFSAFDNFSPIRNSDNSKGISCEYVGLKNINGESFKDLRALRNEFLESVYVCLNSQRKQRWIDAIKILNSDPIFASYKLDVKETYSGDLGSVFDDLSSGHRIILLSITKLVELVDERTLIIFDEPENHLHPPLLSSFIRAISQLLIQRNAVAIIATHSPVVLQEVPKDCVTKIHNVNGIFSLHRPTAETYAENIDSLTRDVFGLQLENSGFYKTIKDHLHQKNLSYEELNETFNNEIGSEGRAIARSLIATSKD